ncbi:unnamed protein product, partial [Pylaiella littoralis]
GQHGACENDGFLPPGRCGAKIEVRVHSHDKKKTPSAGETPTTLSAYACDNNPSIRFSTRAWKTN